MVHAEIDLLISGSNAAGDGGPGQSSLSIFATSLGAGGLPPGNILILMASSFFLTPAGDELRRVFFTTLVVVAERYRSSCIKYTKNKYKKC